MVQNVAYNAPFGVPIFACSFLSLCAYSAKYSMIFSNTEVMMGIVFAFVYMHPCAIAAKTTL